SGKGYDTLVRELLVTPITQGGPGFRPGAAGSSAAAFYVGKEYKPEEIAAATSRLFLGVNLGCAQCHNHPFADWKKEQFWSFAAFFSGIQIRRQGDFVIAQAEKTDLHEITIPGTEKTVKAKYLNGQEAAINPGERSREVLAKWITSRDNPYFARAT